MVVFIGTIHESYYAKKIVEKREEEFQVIDQLAELKNIINDVLRSKASVVILDVSPYTDDIQTIVSAADQIQMGLNCKIIIQAKGYLPGSQIVQAFYNAGYTDFILGINLAAIQKELENCLDGLYVKNGAPAEIVSAAETIKKERPISKKEEEKALKAIRESQKRKITVGVAGSKHYIGTTTQTVQIAKHFQQAGRTVAIVEMNSTRYFGQIAEMERDNKEVQYDESLKKMKMKGLDIYLDPNQITKLIRQKYDCMVYDYGCYYDSDFERISFYEKDINCLVGGSKVNEYSEMNAALLENMDRDNMYYLFSFISQSDAKEIAASMKQLETHTLFATYTPDMFVYSPDNQFDRFFKYKLQMVKKQEKKKFSLFGSRKE
ncbi:MAG: hypothetical protein ACI4F4_04680 [Lachnospiraceae bacterium]